MNTIDIYANSNGGDTIPRKQTTRFFLCCCQSDISESSSTIPIGEMEFCFSFQNYSHILQEFCLHLLYLTINVKKKYNPRLNISTVRRILIRKVAKIFKFLNQCFARL